MRVEIEPGVRLFFDVEGLSHVPDGNRLRKRPTLICLHGGPGHDHSAFKPVFAALATDMQVLYVDQRGMGRSDRVPSTDWTLDRWADDVVALCSALDIVQPFVLGASFGSMVAMRYAQRHPGHAAKLVLVCAMAKVDVDEQVKVLERWSVPNEVKAAAEAFWRDPTPETGTRFLPQSSSLYSCGADLPPSRSVNNYELLFDFLRGEMQTMDLLPGLAGLQTPTLIVGGLEDPVTPAAGMTAIADNIGADQATLVLLEGASHVVWADRPDCITTILNWLVA